MAEYDTERIQQLLRTAANRLSQTGGNSSGLLKNQAQGYQGSAPPRHAPYVRNTDSVAELSRSIQTTKTQDEVQQDLWASRPLKAQLQNPKAKDCTAGSLWFDLPKTVETPELRRDLKLLANRNVLDPHRHYKKESRKPKVPEFSQNGTIVAGPTEFFSGRIVNRERKHTLAADLLAGEKKSGKFNTKFQQLQQAKASGRNRHKSLKSRRKR